MKYHCIILAAGKSTRMKQQKMLLPFNGNAVINSVAMASIQSAVHTTYVITGSSHKPIQQSLLGLNLEIVYNKNYEKGMLSSVQCGVNALEHCDAFLVLPGDQALIQTTSINHLINAFNKSKKGLLIPTYNSKNGHPVIIDIRYKNHIMKLDPNIGLRQLFHEHKEDTTFLKMDTEDVVLDIDIPEDYQKALSHLRNEK